MGVVHKGYDRIRNRMVAIKFMTQGVGGREMAGTDMDQRIYEASAVGRIRSPHVVEFLDFEISEEGIPCLVTALLQGENLEKRLQESPGHRLPWRDAVRIAREAAEGLAAAHREGVLHGDLKPSNLFLERVAKGKDAVRILDFGLALFRSGVATDRSGQAANILGTFAYMAPELGYNRPLSERSDLYSLGIILYEMIVGQVPWRGPPLVILARKATEPLPPLPVDCDVPETLWRLVEDLLRSDPSLRPGSPEEVVARLRSIEEGEGVHGPATGREEPARGQVAKEGKEGRGTPPVRTRFLVPAGVMIAAISLGAWGLLHASSIPLAKVKESCVPDRPVRIRGTVRKSMGLPVGNFSLFQVADRTGSLWVVSMSEAPAEGMDIRMRGHGVPTDRLVTICEGGGWTGEACESLLGLARKWTGPCLLVEDLREP